MHSYVRVQVYERIYFFTAAPQILVNSSTPRSVIPRYRNHVVRPPPLPPLIQQATRAEVK